jgi:hypothetical protein
MHEWLETGFGLETQFIDQLYTQPVTTSNYNSLTGFYTAAHIILYVFASRFLVTDHNNALCLRHYRLSNIPQLN